MFAIFLPAAAGRFIDSISRYLPTAFHRPYLHFTILCALYILLVLWILTVRLRWLFGQLRRKWNPPAPYQPGLLVYYRNAVLFWSFLLIPGIVLMAFAIYLSHYQYIASRVEPLGSATHHGSTLHYTSYTGEEREYEVRGPQVAAAGLFLRFPPWMRFLGLETYHKLITFRSIEENKYHYQRPDADFLKSYADRLYLFLYKKQWLNTYYTESVYFDGGKHRIMVTHSGYIVQ